MKITKQKRLLKIQIVLAVVGTVFAMLGFAFLIGAVINNEVSNLFAIFLSISGVICVAMLVICLILAIKREKNKNAWFSKSYLI